jgi:glycosyltransferase involved in cell wall biosynthesis
MRNSLRRLRESEAFSDIVRLRPQGPVHGRALLSYFTGPHRILQRGGVLGNVPSHDLESVLIAQALTDHGFAVDVIHWRNHWFEPDGSYDVLIDVRHNLQRLAPKMGRDAVKIFHIDVCHILFQNVAESRRLLDLQRRRGVTLAPRRFEFPNLGIEHANVATVLGNGFTMGTFRYARKPMVSVPILPAGDPSWPQGKDFDACRCNFLWFGSGGLVRKGLDLVLEAFARMPHAQLTVCGPLDGDPDFVQAYRKELFETPNIRATGWVDVGSAAFADICKNSLALVYPSCAEGQCGGVVTTMQAGVIPVVSRESGVDVDDFGIIPGACTVDDLIEAVETLMHLPSARLEEMARAARDHALRHHRPQHFLDRYRSVISEFTGASDASPSVARAMPLRAPKRLRLDSPAALEAYGHAVGVG